MNVELFYLLYFCVCNKYCVSFYFTLFLNIITLLWDGGRYSEMSLQGIILDILLYIYYVLNDPVPKTEEKKLKLSKVEKLHVSQAATIIIFLLNGSLCCVVFTVVDSSDIKQRKAAVLQHFISSWLVTD